MFELKSMMVLDQWEVAVICLGLRNFLVLVLLFWSLGSWAQTPNKKRSWKDVGCSTESLYVQATPGAKKVHVPARANCKARARLLGFDISVCDQCKAPRSKDNKPSTTPGKPSKDVTPDEDVDDDSKDDDKDESDQDDDKESGDKKNGNNGHGNDNDKNDSSNPGNSNNGDGSDDDGSPGKSEGKGKSSK